MEQNVGITRYILNWFFVILKGKPLQKLFENLLFRYLCYQNHRDIIEQLDNGSELQHHQMMSFFDPFAPKSDQHLISPYNNSPESHMKVTRIKEMNHQLKNFLIVKQILFVNTLRNLWWTVGRICIMILECKGLNKNQDHFRPVSSNHVGYFFFSLNWDNFDKYYFRIPLSAAFLSIP